jgi:hypothetical protein
MFFDVIVCFAMLLVLLKSRSLKIFPQTSQTRHSSETVAGGGTSGMRDVKYKISKSAGCERWARNI